VSWFELLLPQECADLKIGHYGSKRFSMPQPLRLVPERSLVEVTRAYTTLEFFVAGISGPDVDQCSAN
jgi:hypothetical protein